MLARERPAELRERTGRRGALPRLRVEVVEADPADDDAVLQTLDEELAQRIRLPVVDPAPDDEPDVALVGAEDTQHVRVCGVVERRPPQQQPLSLQQAAPAPTVRIESRPRRAGSSRASAP